LADLYGVFNVMIALVGFGGVISLALWVPAQTNGTIIAFAALYGFTSGCFFSLLPAMVAKLSDVRKLGVRNGAMYAMACTGVLIGSPIAGAIVATQEGDYSGLKIFCGVCLLAATVFAAASRTALVGTKFKIKV
jgi:MFS family permease